MVLCILVDIGLKFYAVLSQPTWVTLKVIDLKKFCVKVFLLNMLMDQVDTWHVGRYWSEVLWGTIKTHLGYLEVKVTDLEILY